MRRLIKRTIGKTNLYQRLLLGKITVLTYHRVLPKSEISDESLSWPMAVDVEMFAEQIAFIKKQFCILDENALVAKLKGGFEHDKKRYAVVTFDDGWRDNYDHVFPVLKSENIPATIFLCTQHISDGSGFWWSELERIDCQMPPGALVRALIRTADAMNAATFSSELRRLQSSAGLKETIEALKRCPARSVSEIVKALAMQFPATAKREVLTWAEVSEMAQAGVCFGPHSRSHCILPALGEDVLEDEIIGCIDDLEAHDVSTSRFFCFPSGAHDDAARQKVAAAGYQFAYALGQKSVSAPCRDEFSVLPRVNVGMHNAGTMDQFRWLLTRAGGAA